MLLLMLLLGLDSSDQRDSQNKGQAGRLARDALHNASFHVVTSVPQ
jgi:hypothetical protein